MSDKPLTSIMVEVPCEWPSPALEALRQAKLLAREHGVGVGALRRVRPEVNPGRDTYVYTFEVLPAAPCCDLHGQHCEPPSELCCERCSEAAHDTFPILHADGSICVLDGA